MTVHIVAARSKNNVIGKGLSIPWRAKGEQKLFRQITTGGTLIMGRITFDSIGRPLPDRKTIIVTRNEQYKQDSCLIAKDLDQAMQLAASLNNPIYIAGGGQIFEQSLPITDIVHLTTIDTTVEGDVFFPAFPNPAFELIEERTYEANINYVYRKYQRIQNSQQPRVSD